MTKDDVKLKLSTIKKHYHREDVQMVMQYFADYKGCHKSGVYDDNGWYQYQAETRRLNDFADPADYQHLSRKTRRRILATLNYFKPEIFQKWTPRDDESPGGFEDTIYLMLSVDIDLADNHTVQDPKTLALLEKAARWFYQRLAAISGEYVLPLFSGNGVYLHLHPGIAYMHKNLPESERRDNFDLLTQCFNLRIQKLEAELYETYPDVIGVVKIDAINNRKRVFKAPLSLHKTLPYIVYPIDPAEFKIPLKKLPLSPADVEAASQMIHDFMESEITPADLDSMALYQLLLEDREGIKTRRREYQELNITPPDDAIPLDVILSEPVTTAIFSPESWSKGNTRRVAYMASLLSITGWDAAAIHEYIENQASAWNVGAFSHVIDSWIGMHPPNIETIYNTGSGYPGMNFGDCSQHLPDRPDYYNQVRIIFQKAREEGLEVSDPYPEPEYHHDLVQDDEPGSPADAFSAEYEDQETILFYHTRHLGGYEDLKTSTGLYGKEYAIIWKALWYQLMSYRIRTADIRMGRIRVDGRINTLYPIKAGNGKGELKRTIKSFVEYFLGHYGEPTSLHAEQMVGKTVKPRGADDYEQRKGYLSDDWLVLDEAYDFLSSNELHYSEARKYLRVALDRYPGNTLHKRATDIGKVAPLEYEPICPASIFLQPKRFDDDRLILEGDLRRLMIPYVNMTGLSKTDAYLDNIFEDEPDEDALIRFCQHIETIPRFDRFNVSTEARQAFAELFMDLISYANNYNPKIRNYAEIIGFTLQGHFLKMAAIQALQCNSSTIQPYHVELAYMDLFEMMHHNYQYINNKIPGFLNYGEGWQGAEALDQELLAWLYQQGALTYETSIKGADYVDEIIKKYKVKERRARDILKDHQRHGWIVVKQIQRGSSIWLNFDPELQQDFKVAECTRVKSSGGEIVHNQISNNNYKYFNINYLFLLDLQLQPPAFCNLEHSGKKITPEVDEDPQQLDDPILETSSTTTPPQDTNPITLETINPPIQSTPADADIYEVALRAASQSFYQNSHWTGWTYTIPFLDQIEVATGIEDPEPLYQLKTRMIHDGYITQKGPQSEIKASNKFIELIKARRWDNVTSTPA